MKPKKPNKETAIKLILEGLKSGIDKLTIWDKLGQNETVPKSTFCRWYVEAEKEYNKFLTIAKPIIEAKEIEALGEAAKNNILTKLERQKILTEMALGNVTHQKEVATKFGVETVVVCPTWADRRAAIAELNKMDGDYATTKTEVTVKPDLSSYSTDELILRASLMDKLNE